MAHAHSVYDTDVSFKIDTKTKAIKKGSSMRTKLVQGDHNSEKFTFTLNSRHVEGHDMTLCNRVELHYINTDIETRCRTSKNFAVLDDLTVDLDTDNVTCSWMVTRGATKYAGLLQFLLTFKCIDDSGEEVYSWSTTWFTGMQVLPGGDNSDYVLEEFNDAFEQLRREVLDAAEKTSEEIKAAVREELAENPPMAGATAAEAAQIAQNKQNIATLDRTKLAASELPNAVNEALAQAKASGAFDGKTPVKGTDYFTEADKQEIARQAAGMVEPPKGGGIDVTGAEVGQIIKVSAVDGNGKPTAWEAVDMPKSAQADWSQNDESAPDYVRNRPFYESVARITVIEEQTASFDMPVTVTPSNSVSTSQYFVVWDGVEYEVANEDGCFWNDLFFFELSLSGEFYMVEATEPGNHTFSVSAMVGELRKIERKYLPIPSILEYTYDPNTDRENYSNVEGRIVITDGKADDYSPLDNPESVTRDSEGFLYVPGAKGGNVSEFFLTDIGITKYTTRAVGYSVTKENIPTYQVLNENGVGRSKRISVGVYLSDTDSYGGITHPSYVVPLTQYAKDHGNENEVEWTGMIAAVDGSFWSVYASRNTDGTANITVTKRL